MSKKKRTTLKVVRPNAPVSEDLRTVAAGLSGVESLRKRMLSRVTPLVWDAMLTEIHEVVDRYVMASDSLGVAYPSLAKVKLVV